jgi:hypothetical protein
LEHRAIVPVYDFGEEDGRPYLVMRLMTGGSLADRLRTGALSPAVIQRVLDRIGAALDKAHAQGIVHRDLKPGNILFDDDGQPYLSDFGIVKSAESTKLTATGGMIGTPTYMSPEQVMGTSEIDGRSDIYALGVVLYEMLTGRQPYESETGMGMAMAHVTRPVPQLRETAPQLPAGYQAIIDRAMAKKPEDRYQRGADLATAFRNPPQVYAGDRTLIEGFEGATVIESYGGSAATTGGGAVITPVDTTPARAQESGGLPWKIIAPAVLLLIALFGAYAMRGMFLPPSEPATPTADTEFVALAGTVTAQAQEMALAAISETAAAGARETVAAEMQETATARSLEQENNEAAQATPTTAVEEKEEEVQPVIPSDTPTPTETSSPTPTNTPQPDLGPEWIQIGQTYNGKPIEAVRFGAGPKKIVLVGGLHAGFAPATVVIGERLASHFTDNPQEVPAAITVYVIPSVNKDSVQDPGEWLGRANGNKVDLNRNWDCDWIRDATWRGSKVNNSGGSGPFSEPETRALRDFFLDIDPVTVIIWEALFKDGLISPGQCDSATNTTRTSFALAGVYGSASGYAVDNYEVEANQTINGDANNWLDKVGIPNFAVLLDKYEDPAWSKNLEGVRAVIAYHAN